MELIAELQSIIADFNLQSIGFIVNDDETTNWTVDEEAYIYNVQETSTYDENAEFHGAFAYVRDGFSIEEFQILFGKDKYVTVTIDNIITKKINEHR